MVPKEEEEKDLMRWIEFDSDEDMDDFVMEVGDLKLEFRIVNEHDNVIDRDRKIKSFEEWGLHVKLLVDRHSMEGIPKDMRARLNWASHWLFTHRDA